MRMGADFFLTKKYMENTKDFLSTNDTNETNSNLNWDKLYN